MPDTAFYILELTGAAPEVYRTAYKHYLCSKCGMRPLARVGTTGVKFSKSEEMDDFTYTDEGLIARSTIFETLSKHKLAGWRQGVLDIQVEPHIASVNSDYYELIVIGRTRGYAQAVDLKIRKECDECGTKGYWRPLHGLPMPNMCWDKCSDIFAIPELPGLYLVTDQMRAVIQEAQFTGVECIHTGEWHADLLTQRDAERAGVHDSDPDESDKKAARLWPPLKF